MNRILIVLGVLLIAVGVLWPLLTRLNLLHLPGDIVVDRPGFKLFFPVTTMVLLSLGLSLLAWLLRR